MEIIFAGSLFSVLGQNFQRFSLLKKRYNTVL